MSERAIPVVDAHQHFWDLGRNRIPWLQDEPPIHMRYADYSSIRRDYLPPDYLRDSAGFDVVKTVYVETEYDPDDPLSEVRWVRSVMAEHGYPHAVVAQAWLDREGVEAVLEAYAATGVVRSVRHKPTVMHSQHAPSPGPRGSMSDSRWRRGFGMLRRCDLAFDLQVVWYHLPEAAVLAADFPDTQIIVNHTGLPPGRDEASVRAWRAALDAVSVLPNVAIKISGLGMRDEPWTAQANRRVVLETIESFGVDRCMFASNFPVDSLAAPFATIYGGFFEIVADFAEHERRALFHDNAVRYYRL